MLEESSSASSEYYASAQLVGAKKSFLDSHTHLPDSVAQTLYSKCHIICPLLIELIKFLQKGIGVSKLIFNHYSYKMKK